MTLCPVGGRRKMGDMNHDRKTVHAYVLIQTRAGRAGAVTEALRPIPGVITAQTVGGPYDVVAFVESSDLDDLMRSVLVPIQAVEGITRTVTCPVLLL